MGHERNEKRRSAGKRLKFFFDKEGDVLDIAVGRPKKAISRSCLIPEIREYSLKNGGYNAFTIILRNFISNVHSKSI